jgi:hypothetical protein
MTAAYSFIEWGQLGPKVLGPSMVRIDRHGRVLENRHLSRPFRLVRKLTALLLPPTPSLPSNLETTAGGSDLAKEKAPLFNTPFDSIRSARRNSPSGFHRRSGCE